MDEFEDTFQRIMALASTNPERARALAASLDGPVRALVLQHVTLAAAGVVEEALNTFLDLGRLEAVRLRDKVCALASIHTGEALDLARTIKEPWYRGQALAHVARFSDDENVLALAAEAMDAFDTAEDKYNAVAGAAWPVRALIERGRISEAGEMLKNAVGQVALIEKNVSRAHALYILWEAACPVEAFAHELIGTVFDVCVNANSWRGPVLLKRVLLVYAQISPERAGKFIAAMPECKEKRQAFRSYEAGASWSPRNFF